MTSRSAVVTSTARRNVQRTLTSIRRQPIQLTARLCVGTLMIAGQCFLSPLVAEDVAIKEAAPSEAAAAAASRERLANDLQYLSSDALEGRDTGSEGIEKAAEFIANRFDELGLNTNLYDGTPFQVFTALRDVEMGSAEANGLSIQVGDGELSTHPLNETMLPLAIGGSGEVTAPLVFVGYGITAPDANYDDYAGLDVTGKIVVMLRGEPRSGRDDNPLGGRRNSRFAFFTTKIENAVEHGAAGVLLVNHAEATAQVIEQAEARLTREQERLASTESSLANLPEDAVNSRERLTQTLQLIRSQIAAAEADVASAPEALLAMNQAGNSTREDAIPVVSFGRRACNALFASLAKFSSDEPLAEIEASIDETFAPASFQLEETTATIRASIVTRDVIGKNVIAELPGKGNLAEETIVIGAHYDHVGMGGRGSLAPGTIAIHNGADDNGSGTVTMLETARRITEMDLENHRRIVFMAFTAEEKGLLGSKHYAREPRFALETTTGMINLDMVGRLNDEEKLTVFGTGTAPEFDGLVDAWTEKFQLPVRKDVSGYGPSDHTSFYEQKVPVLFFFTGLHTDYHRPSDDFEKINLDGMVRITDMVCEAALYLATVPVRPTFQTTGPGAGVNRARANRRPAETPPPAAFMGVAMEDVDGTVVVTAVVEQGPAAQAGIRPGDSLVRLGETKTTSMAEVQTTVGEQRPGNVLDVTINRGGDEITVKVKLGERP